MKMKTTRRCLQNENGKCIKKEKPKLNSETVTSG